MDILARWPMCNAEKYIFILLGSLEQSHLSSPNVPLVQLQLYHFAVQNPSMVHPCHNIKCDLAFHETLCLTFLTLFPNFFMLSLPSELFDIAGYTQILLPSCISRTQKFLPSLTSAATFYLYIQTFLILLFQGTLFLFDPLYILLILLI